MLPKHFFFDSLASEEFYFHHELDICAEASLLFQYASHIKHKSHRHSSFVSLKLMAIY